MRAKTINEMEFNFKQPPYKQYEKPAKGSGSRWDHKGNPNKNGYGGGLSSEEQDLINNYRDKIQDFQREIESFEGQLEDLNYELNDLYGEPTDEGELEQYYADVQSRYGENVLDALNSGIPLDQKIDLVDKVHSGNDRGKREAEGIVAEYTHYHPEDPDPEEVERIKSAIKKAETLMKERENSKDKLETKIYNIEKY